MSQEHSYELLMEQFDVSAKPTIQRISSNLRGEAQLAASMLRWVGELFINGGYDAINAHDELPRLFDQLNALEKLVDLSERLTEDPLALNTDELNALKAVLHEKTASLNAEREALEVWCTAQIISEMTVEDLSSDEDFLIPSGTGDPVMMSPVKFVIHHVEAHHHPDNPYKLPIITFTGKVP